MIYYFQANWSIIDEIIIILLIINSLLLFNSVLFSLAFHLVKSILKSILEVVAGSICLITSRITWSTFQSYFIIYMYFKNWMSNKNIHRMISLMNALIWWNSLTVRRNLLYPDFAFTKLAKIGVVWFMTSSRASFLKSRNEKVIYYDTEWKKKRA